MNHTELIVIPQDEANALLASGGHYLGPVKYPPRYCITTKDRMAVAVYAPVMASGYKRVGGKETGEPIFGIAELTRLWVHPDATFKTSEFLAASLTWLKVNGTLKQLDKKTKRLIAEHPIKCVISYADPRVGHVGSIYQVTSWIYLGESTVTDTFEVVEPCEFEGYKGTTYTFKPGERVTLNVCYRIWKTKKKSVILEKTAGKWKDLGAVAKHAYMFPFVRRPNQIAALLAQFPRYKDTARVSERGKGPPKKPSTTSENA